MQLQMQAMLQQARQEMATESAQLMSNQRVEMEQAMAAERVQTQTAFVQQVQMANDRASQAERAADLARQMLEAAAAQAMASATAQQQTASSSSNFQQARLPSELQVELKPILDVKILEKLEMFNVRSECWESWLTGFESLAGLIGLDNLMAISVQPGLSWSETALSQLGGDDVRLKAKALWYLLTQACKGKSQNIVKKAESS